MDIDGIDTKAQIFNVGLRLFAANGYENVSLRTIAKAVGIKASSIYYHFKSKEDLLNACYDFFLQHRHFNRLTREQYEPIVRLGTKQEFLKVLIYDFPADILGNMILALVIIFTRIYSDDKAKSIYMDDINQSMEYLIEFFSYGVKIGRFAPFNIKTVALVILSSRLFSAQSVTMDPKQENEWFQAANDVFDDLLRLIPFKY